MINPIVKKQIEDYTKLVLHNHVFEINDSLTRRSVTKQIEDYLSTFRKADIYDYQVVCDTRNNTPQIIDANELAVDIYLKPKRSVQYMSLNFIITPKGTITFDDLFSDDPIENALDKVLGNVKKRA